MTVVTNAFLSAPQWACLLGFGASGGNPSDRHSSIWGNIGMVIDNALACSSFAQPEETWSAKGGLRME